MSNPTSKNNTTKNIIIDIAVGLTKPNFHDITPTNIVKNKNTISDIANGVIPNIPWSKYVLKSVSVLLMLQSVPPLEYTKKVLVALLYVVLISQ
jgi:hypothetical protein